MSSLPDNFKDYPKSVSEMKAEKEENCELWTPRDCLISLLRKIDNNEIKITDIVICYGKKSKDNITMASYTQAGSHNHWETLGLIERVKWMLHEGATEVDEPDE